MPKPNTNKKEKILNVSSEKLPKNTKDKSEKVLIHIKNGRAPEEAGTTKEMIAKGETTALETIKILMNKFFQDEIIPLMKQF